MTYKDEDLIQISAIQHYVFCRRQCALIHIEQLWIENLFTAEGRQMHEKAHEETVENRKNIRIERGIPLRSAVYGLSGKADIIEYHKDENKKWFPFPVEYKRGKPKLENCDKVQLCAQTLCLEEMMNVSVANGALYYGKTKHRYNVEFDEILRQETVNIINEVRIFIKKRITPRPRYSKKCKSCSLLEVCLPKPIEKGREVKNYILKEINKL